MKAPSGLLLARVCDSAIILINILVENMKLWVWGCNSVRRVLA